MVLDRVCPRRHAPRWLPLLLDVALVGLFLLLDVRDLWFKLRWVGPHDAFVFSTVETKYLPGLDAAPLQPTTTFSYADQKSQRGSGWSSFLEKCESLAPLTEEDEIRGFRYVVARNCMIGAGSGAVRATELLLTSSIRVDSMAWTACELLYKNRKPPICHSPIVIQFRKRYNLLNEVAIEPSSAELTNSVAGNTPQESYAVKPGSEAEAELIELLEVISKSSPISAAVCVEGFILKGPGRYTSTIYGCGSPSFYRSSFIGGDIPMFAQFQRDKGWLTSHTISIMGMKFLIRENRHSIFTIRNPVSGHDVKRVFEHLSLINCSASGALYTLMILIDFTLVVLSIYSVVEIARFVLWPLWKPLVASEYQTSSARTTKMGYAVEDYARVIQVGLLWSTPVALLTVISRLITWILVIPSVNLWSDGNLGIGDMYVFLTMIRFCDLVVVCVNIIWSMIVAYDEKRALAFVRQVYVSPLEITGIGVAVAVGGIPSVRSQIYSASYHHDQLRLIDRTSFESVTAIANTFGLHQNSSIPSLDIYYPLMIFTGIIVLIVGVLVASRFSVGKAMISQSLVQSASASVSMVQSSTALKECVVTSSCNDLTSSSAGILMRTVPPGSVHSTVSTESTSPFDISGGRLPIENMVDIPIRARSMVRRSWVLEKMTDGQLLLLPASYLKYGIVLVGRSMKTRSGFMDVVQPLVRAQEHNKPNELENEPQLRTNTSSFNVSPNLR